ncbi:CDP-glycerol glycerophosphotransferase family protein [Candidatus Auribacterota bacterium]
MNLLKEISDIIRFFKLPRDRRNIVFYAEHEGYYVNFEGVIEELTKKHQKDICYVTSDPLDPALKISDPNMYVFYINKLLILFMMTVECKVLVMTMTDLNQFHIKRSRHPVQYVYIFHSMVSTHMMYRDGAFDHYDHILCTGPYQEREIRRREELKGLSRKELIGAGYYRLERIYDKHKNLITERKEIAATKARKHILIAPSWGENNILKNCGEKLCAILLKNGYDVTVRPHPETVRRSPVLIKQLASKFGTQTGFALETSVASDDSLISADVMICDCSGAALEYAFGTERPVLFIDVPPKIKNEDYGQLDITPFELLIRPEIGLVIKPEETDNILHHIEKLASERMAYRANIIKLREQNVYNFGTSSKVGAKLVIKILGSNLSS